jgi:hypothetical protein
MKSTRGLLERFFRDIPLHDLSPTLHDSVTVCRKLGINFLWVDAFCIVQDDPEDKEDEIAQMLNIYSSAVVTIAASRARSVTEGFLGPRLPTQFPHHVFELPYLRTNGQRGCITLIRTKSEAEPLDTRGWTLQERLLSPRTLGFGTLQLRWICQNCRASHVDGWTQRSGNCSSRRDYLEEDLHPLQRWYDAMGEVPKDALGDEFMKAMRSWYFLVRGYTHRNLTEPTDRILAISRMAQIYSKAFGDEYCTGFWKSTLPSSSLWQTEGQLIKPCPKKFQGPSWSWTAINSPVEFPSTFKPEEISLKVLDCATQLENSKNPYGAVREGYAQLAVRRRLLPGILYIEKTPNGDVGYEATASFFTMNDRIISARDNQIFRINSSTKRPTASSIALNDPPRPITLYCSRMGS